MTNQEAIDYLTALWNSDYLSVDETIALEMAIKALKAEPCEDCVRRKDAINTVNNIYNSCRECTLEEYRDTLIESFNVLCGVISARKKGHWIMQNDRSKKLLGWSFCSECNAWIGEPTDYCSNCGADMREVDG